MPPELLHTSGNGLIMYMFESLRLHLGDGIDWDYIDQEHIVVSNIIQWQSERDFPRGSVAAKIGSPLESDLSIYSLQIQKGPTDLFKGFPGNT